MTSTLLKEASMKRLSMKIRDAQETLGKQLLFCSSINPEDLEPSGLNVLECEHLSRWVKGLESGRHCMLALLECHKIEADISQSSKSSQPSRLSEHHHLTFGAPKRSFEVSSLGKSVNLPDEFLCDSGYLYENFFSKPPSAVLKEGLQILAHFANERSSTALTTEQINLGLKQIRVENLIDVGQTPNNAGANKDKENNFAENIPGVKQSKGTQERNTAESYRLQLIIELLRMHIVESKQTSSNQKDFGNKSQSKRKILRPKIESLFDASINSQQLQQRILDEELDFQQDADVEERCQDDEEEEEGFTLYSIHPPLKDLETQLSQCKDQCLHDVEKLSDADLDASNRVLLPYVSQLMTLKTSLGSYIEYLNGSKAYLSFGLDKDCDAAALKKAYHAKAVKLHPDKKGGDKEKFQKLNDMYQEMLKVKLEESEVSDEIESEWKAESDTVERAQDIMTNLEKLLYDIKVATSACTALAQTGHRWKKKIMKAAKLPCPQGIDKLVELLQAPKRRSDGSALSVKDSSCLLAEEHLQTISISVSQMVSELMSLVSLGRYGVATGRNLQVMKNIEHLAKCGLSAQKCISSLAPVEAQVDSLQARMDLSHELSRTDRGVHDVLVQIFCTSFNARHMTLGMAADSCVMVALTAAEICLAAKKIIKTSDEDFKKDLKRKAKRREEQDQYCKEDQDLMAEMLEKQRQESREEDLRREQEKAEEEERHKAEGTEMEYLKEQVKSLQVKLRLQNIEALQTLNSDVCSMQEKLQLHMREVNTLGADKRGDKLQSASQTKSLLGLLAEFIDSSCLSYRNRLASRTFELEETILFDPSSVLNMFSHNFGWMIALGRKRSDAVTGSKTQEPCSVESTDADAASQRKKRLALVPDFRSKVLWVCTLLDVKAVQGLISSEFRCRLTAIVQNRIKLAGSSEVAGALDENIFLEKLVDIVCGSILDGIDSAFSDFN